MLVGLFFKYFFVGTLKRLNRFILILYAVVVTNALGFKRDTWKGIFGGIYNVGLAKGEAGTVNADQVQRFPQKVTV